MRKPINYIGCTILGLSLIAESAVAAPFISGIVSARNGTPLEGVHIQVDIRTSHSAPPSDPQGHFQFDSAPLFTVQELRAASGLTLTFSKTGFHPATKVIRFSPGQSPSPISIQLDPTSGSGSLQPAERDVLNKFIAAPGTLPLFLIPYSFTGIESADPKRVNELMRTNLERVIITHLQAAGVNGSQAVSMKLLPLDQTVDIERLRTYGSALNALGMVSGYGAVEPAAAGMASLGVSSTFLVVPQAEPPVGAPVLYVDDTVPADSLASPRLYKYLSKLWGRSTVLALGINEYHHAVASHDKHALTRIRHYLQAERAGAGPGDEALISQLNVLIGAVDKELGK